MSLQHEMPEKSAIELSNRQRQILYDREVKNLSRADIAERYERLDGSGQLKVRGVESYLREARKKRRLAVNTLVYAEQKGYFDIANTDLTPPSELDLPDYVELPTSVHHNDTALFEQQKQILNLIVEHDNDNRSIVKELIDEDELVELASELGIVYNQSVDEDGILYDGLKQFVDGDGSFTDLRSQAEQQLHGSRESLIEDVRKHTNKWSRDDLASIPLTDLFCRKVAAEHLYDKKYSTLRQYKYYRLPEKLQVCIETAQQPT